MLTVPTCTSTPGERYQETMKLVLSMFYTLLSPDNHLSLTRNTNSVTSRSSIVCCSSKLLCSGIALSRIYGSGCCQHRISMQRPIEIICTGPIQNGGQSVTIVILKRAWFWKESISVSMAEERYGHARLFSTLYRVAIKILEAWHHGSLIGEVMQVMIYYLLMGILLYCRNLDRIDHV